MTEINREQVKEWAIAIVNEVEPEDVFLVEDGYDALVEEWHRAETQDEGRLIGGPEVATFAAMAVPFLLGFFRDVAKDVVKDQVKTAVGGLLDRILKRRATADDAETLRTEINTAIGKGRFSSAEKAELQGALTRCSRSSRRPNDPSASDATADASGHLGRPSPDRNYHHDLPTIHFPRQTVGGISHPLYGRCHRWQRGHDDGCPFNPWRDHHRRALAATEPWSECR